MFIKNLFGIWRQNVALHCTLETKSVSLIDHQTRGLVKMDNVQDATAEKIQLRGRSKEGIEVLADIELIGDPALLKQFGFEQGKFVGLVLRTIDST